MPSPYVANTDQLTANLMQLIQGNKQMDRQDAQLQQQQKIAQDQQKLQVAGAQALELRDLPTFEQKRTGLLRLAQNAIQQGGDPSAWEKLTEIQDVDELNLALRQMAIRSSDAGKLINDRLQQKGEIEQKQVNVLRKSITDTTKTYKVIDEAERKINSIGRKGTPASDMALVFSFMKIMDPGSTVREGEYASAQNTTGVPGQILNAYNKAIDGTILNPSQREDFLQQAQSLADSQRTATDVQIEDILQQADQDQIERERVLGKNRLEEFNKRKAEREPQQIQEGATATNPQTGQKLRYTNGKWQPAS